MYIFVLGKSHLLKLVRSGYRTAQGACVVMFGALDCSEQEVSAE